VNARPAGAAYVARSRRYALALGLALSSWGVHLNASADCVDDAAQFHTVNPWILRAIAMQESGGNPNAVGRNSNGTVDLGNFGINSVHLPELARYGIARNDLFDPCKSVYVASWRLSKMVRKYGNTWEAVGAYHSETPVYRNRYAQTIKQIVSSWMASGILGQR
jgi:soluble lytic murein transglycosylase-like protein